MKIYIGADHGGFELKKEIIEYVNGIKENGVDIEIEDMGTYSGERTDYPIYAQKVCEKVIGDKGSKGILICKSGHGMTYAANKFKGIRASLAYSRESLSNGIADDDLNVVCLASNDTKLVDAIEYIDVMLSTKFKDYGKYIERVKMVEDLEK